MPAKLSPRVNQKRNKGGRPRINGKGIRGNTSTIWKPISRPVSTLKYEINNRGEVRRELKYGGYTPVKPWITGGPYAAVYIYGIKGPAHNRKKVYIHRLVADHFVAGKSNTKVVHHLVGPSTNTAKALQWVTPSENNKARKFFNDDGSRKQKRKKC